MDCDRAQLLLSQVHDEPETSFDDFDEALAHCRICPDCARFQTLLGVLDAAPTPVAPPKLIDDIMDRISAEIVPSLENAPLVEGPSPAARFRLPGWQPRFTLIAATAAVLVVAVLATGIGLGVLFSANQSQEQRVLDLPSNSGERDMIASPQSETSSEALPATDATEGAPPYVTLDGVVYSVVGSEELPEAVLATAGVVVSALDGNTVAEHNAYVVTVRTMQIALKNDDGSVMVFEAVLRSFQHKPYVLVSGNVVERYGVWPTLPSRFAVPTEQDGGPTFVPTGTDDNGIRVYAPFGSQPLDGFAVSPGTDPQSDPAAGSPNWTWWEPYVPPPYETTETTPTP